MHYSKILIVSIPVFLAGCLDVFEDDSSNFYTPPKVNVPAPTPAHVGPRKPSGPGIPSGTTGCGCSGSEVQHQPGPSPIPCDALAPSSASVPNADWRPLEGHLVRAGDLVMELQRGNGGVRPTHAAMSKHIQSNMGLTAHQAELVLEEMGL